MWIRNLPLDYQNQISHFDNLVFLWKTDKVYVMDNHLAAAWCWMQECNADSRYNFLHIDRHNDLGTGTPFYIYNHLVDNQHLSIDDYTGLNWVNEGNDIRVKAFLWDNYITQCSFLFPIWFQDTAFATRTPLDRTEREKLLGVIIQDLSCSDLLNFIDDNIHIDEDGEQLNNFIGHESRKWIVNLDLDYFYHADANGCFQILTDDYISSLAVRLRENQNQIQVLTIALSPECCGGWNNSIHALNVFMAAFKAQNMEFPNEYL